MFGTAFFSGEKGHEALVIPREALVGSVKEPKVYVVEHDTAWLKEIRIGQADNREVEVTEGLNPGEVVVTSGQINLEDQTHVTIVNK